MIFLSLIAVGILAGLAFGARRKSALHMEDAAYSGAVGAFLVGGIVAGIATRSIGPFDPIALAAGIAGAIGFVLLAELLSDSRRSGPGGHADVAR